MSSISKCFLSLFHTFQGFHHVYFFQLEMHGKVYEKRKSAGNETADHKAHGLYVSAKHYGIHLYRSDHIAMKENPESPSTEHSDNGEQDIFPEYILGNL